jgi:hypothetical protein
MRSLVPSSTAIQLISTDSVPRWRGHVRRRTTVPRTTSSRPASSRPRTNRMRPRVRALIVMATITTTTAHVIPTAMRWAMSPS